MSLPEKILQRIEKRYTPDQYGALAAQYAEWSVTQPLLGLKILDATPLFDNTLLKYRNLLAAGAELTIGLSPLLSNHPDALHFATQELGLKATADQGAYDIVLDCAAAFSGSEAQLGYVELTKSGVESYKNSHKNVYVADSGRIKEIETEYGTGESLFKALDRLELAGSPIVLFGAGKVGRGIWREAVRRGVAIEVVADPATSLIPGIPIHDYRNQELVEQLIERAWGVVMATGVAGALGKTVDAQRVCQSKALLINMGADDEFGTAFSAERLVAGGRTLNFLLDEPTPLRYIDPTLTLHNFGALYWAARPKVAGLQFPDQTTEDKILKDSQLEGVKI